MAAMHRLQQAAMSMLRGAGVGTSDPVMVACSGGPDSVALADAAMELAAHRRLGPVTLLHVDHGLRPGSAEEAAVVQRHALRGGADFLAVAVDVDRSEASLEAAAREARYAALEQEWRTAGCHWVLLGHTASDQAETVLMRILRGSGLAGLAGIPPVRPPYVRPLLAITRQQVLDYVAERELEYSIDPSNEDGRFTRNRVRHHWLVALEKENPRIAESLVRLARSAREQREVLELAAAELRARAERADGSLDVGQLARAPAAAVKHLLSVYVTERGGGPLTARHLEALLDQITAAPHGTTSVDVPGARWIRSYDSITVEEHGCAARSADLPTVPGYRVRQWQAGDRMRPVRLRGRSRKLSDLYIDAKIPRSARAAARVLTDADSGEIVWAEHLGPAVGFEDLA